MRLVAPGDGAPASVNRYLLPAEHMVITVRFHPAVLFGPGVLVLAGLVTAAVASIVSNLSKDALLILWLTWGLLMIYLISKVARWSIDYYVVTTNRMLVVKGLFARDVAMIPLARAASIRLRRSTMGRIFGYGQFIVESHGQDQTVRNINFLPYPEQLYLEVCGLIFPRAAAGDAYETGDGYGSAPDHSA